MTLHRRARLPARRATPRRGPARDPAYLAWVRSLPCLLAGLGCEGAVEAHHAGRRGLGQKCPDREAVPLCRRHHRDLTDGQIPFARREARRAWERWAIEQTQARWERLAAPSREPRVEVES